MVTLYTAKMRSYLVATACVAEIIGKHQGYLFPSGFSFKFWSQILGRTIHYLLVKPKQSGNVSPLFSERKTVDTLTLVFNYKRSPMLKILLFDAIGFFPAWGVHMLVGSAPNPLVSRVSLINALKMGPIATICSAPFLFVLAKIHEAISQKCNGPFRPAELMTPEEEENQQAEDDKKFQAYIENRRKTSNNNETELKIDIPPNKKMQIQNLDGEENEAINTEQVDYQALPGYQADDEKD